MRPAHRLLASVKPVAARYLEAGAPTGLTGLRAYPSPRATLLYLYSTTLDKLGAGVPETSLYRQSVEAVTRQRLALVQAVQPAGYDEWHARAQEMLERHPGRFDDFARPTADGSTVAGVERGGRFFVVHHRQPRLDERYEEWDSEPDLGPALEGTRTSEERKGEAEQLSKDPFDGEDVEWVDEPKLTIDQIEELENKIGAGLIEEVIQVAEGELKLVDNMIQGKVWESLDEKPREGQWKYFERKE